MIRHKTRGASCAAIALTMAGLGGCGYVRGRALSGSQNHVGAVWRYTSPSPSLVDATFSPDGSRVLVRGDYATRVLDTESENVLSSLDCAGEVLLPWRYLVGAIYAVPLLIGELSGRPAIAGPGGNAHRGPTPAAATVAQWSADSSRVYLASALEGVREYRLDDSQVRRTITELSLPETAYLTGLSPCGKVLVINDVNGPTVLRWFQRPEAHEISFARGSSVSFAFHTPLACVSEPSGHIRLLSLESGEEVSAIGVEEGARGYLSEDGRVLLIDREPGGFRDHPGARLLIVNLDEEGEIVGKMPCDVKLRGHLIDWSAGSQRAAITDANDGTVVSPSLKIIDLRDGAELHRLAPKEAKRIRDLSPDGRLMIQAIAGSCVLYQLPV